MPTSACWIAATTVAGSAGGQDKRDEGVHVLVRGEQFEALPGVLAGHRGPDVHGPVTVPPGTSVAAAA